MTKILTLIGSLGNKIIDLFSKKAKNGEKQQDIELKQQDIEIKKVNEYKQVVVIVVCVALFMCMIASFFPGLAISEWWFNLAETVINNKL